MKKKISIDQILTVANDCYLEKNGFSFEDIATKLDVNRGVIHAKVKSKKNLARIMLDQYLQVLVLKMSHDETRAFELLRRFCINHKALVVMCASYDLLNSNDSDLMRQLNLILSSDEINMGIGAAFTA